MGNFLQVPYRRAYGDCLCHGECLYSSQPLSGILATLSPVTPYHIMQRTTTKLNFVLDAGSVEKQTRVNTSG